MKKGRACEGENLVFKRGQGTEEEEIKIAREFEPRGTQYAWKKLNLITTMTRMMMGVSSYFCKPMSQISAEKEIKLSPYMPF